MRKVLFVFFFFLLTLFFPTSALGQGTYSCQPLASNPSGCQAGTGFQFNKCDSGYRPGTECNKFSFTTCTGTFACVRDTGVSSCQADYRGTCKISCSSGEALVGGFGTLGCANPTAFCCAPKKSCSGDYGGTCKISCSGNETESRDGSQLSCSAPANKCCIASNTSGSGPLAGLTCQNNTGLATAIGCIPINDPNAFLAFILNWAIGIGGGIAFLLIVYASFMIMTSSGNPDRLKAGQELLTSALMGVVLMVFSVFILKVIGVDILKIPGFGN